MRLARILRDYDDAGGLNELISLWGFVDDHVFLTKAGHVGLVYAVRGVDYEGLTHQQRQALVHQVEAGLRMFGIRSSPRRAACRWPTKPCSVERHT